MLHLHVVSAVLRRDFKNFFNNLTGYVFITIFVVACAVFNFMWGDNRFYSANMANFSQLNEFFPYLLIFFIPAVSMTLWAEERKQGTDELLLTLPARDVDIVIGKFFAGLSIYTISLLFTLTLALVLAWMGNPDFVLTFSNYLGFWFLGAALLALGMVGSLLSGTATVGFVLGAIFCACPFAVSLLSRYFEQSLALPLPNQGLGLLDINEHFAEFGRGSFRLAGVAFFVCWVAFALYLNVVLLGRRHWRGGADGRDLWWHLQVRALAVGIAAVALVVLCHRFDLRGDLTSEKLHTIKKQTVTLVEGLDAGRQVLVVAFISPDVPRQFIQTKIQFENILRQLENLSRGKLKVRIVETRKNQESAEEAKTVYGIEPRKVMRTDGGRFTGEDIFLGFAVSCDGEREVTEFLDPGLSPEYELIRSIITVSRQKRRKVGVVDNDLKLFGGFDFQTRQQSSQWQLIAELRKQYEVVPVNPDEAIPSDLDALIAIMPSALSQQQLDHLEEYMLKGRPTLLLDDPVAAFAPSFSAKLPLPPKGNPMMGGRPPGEKGNLRNLMAKIGVGYDGGEVVFDKFNPLPKYQDLPPECVFLTAEGGRAGISQDSPLTRDLQRILMFFAGRLRPVPAPGSVEPVPLLTTGSEVSGVTPWEKVVMQDFLFGARIMPMFERELGSGNYVVAARIRGKFPTAIAGEQGGASASNVGVEAKIIVVADVDVISDTFFSLRRQGDPELRFDNIPFILNCLDDLVGDNAFIELRKPRRTHRTLTKLEEPTAKFDAERMRTEQTAREEAKEILDKARESLRNKIEEIKKRTDLDAQDLEILAGQAERAEEKKFEALQGDTERKKEEKIEKANAAHARSIERLVRHYNTFVLLLPPIPVILLGLIVFLLRRQREWVAVSARRRL